MGGGVGVQGGRQQQPKLPSIQVGLHFVSIYILTFSFAQHIVKT